MGCKINEQITTFYYYGISSISDLAYIVYDELHASFATGNMTELGSTGMYYANWTPDTAGIWVFSMSRGDTKDAFVYHVEMGQEEDILDTQREVIDAVVYIVAEDMSTTEGSDDGSSPALTSEVSQANANEAAGVAAPAWTEDIDLEQEGTITTISIFYDLNWQMKRTGGTTAYAKWQISGNGGSSWTDITDSVTETSTSYVDKQRIFSGRHLTSITAGANKLHVRLCAWTDGTTVETKVRSDSYVRLTYRKGP